MLKKISMMAAVFIMPLTLGSLAVADVNMQTVAVGNPGNTGELSGGGAGGSGPDRICGAVGYAYKIGKFEVTAGQYTQFLNAVATTDTYELYRREMWEVEYGCKIQRSGTPGNYAYSVAADWANRPANWVSWFSAARFCNWLTNGQPTGAQGSTTTEDGSYTLNGDNDPHESRNANAKYVIPTEDEWYKAAYHKNDGVTGNYWDYPTGTDAVPSNDLINPDPGNNANFNPSDHPSGYTIGSPYWRTEVGQFENSESPYGTFDQGGNVYEWNETILFSDYRGYLGGSYGSQAIHLCAVSRESYDNPNGGGNGIGFRVAYIPEPATLSLLALGGLALIRRPQGTATERKL